MVCISQVDESRRAEGVERTITKKKEKTRVRVNFISHMISPITKVESNQAVSYQRDMKREKGQRCVFMSFIARNDITCFIFQFFFFLV